LDDDGQGTRDILIKASVEVSESGIQVSFDGSSPQVAGNLNCPLTVTVAGVLYVFRCLLPSDAPACHGLFDRISISAPKNTLLNADYPAAVAAGNVETSQRIVDVVIGALAQALPELMPAASQGTMNNLAMGGVTLSTGRRRSGQKWSYYETICGGSGAHSDGDGLSAIQSHMTNTLNTPIEVLESNFPLRLQAYRLRKESGGEGRHSGGEGVVREYEFLDTTQVSLISERREHRPWGLQGGGSGNSGANYLNGKAIAGKQQIQMKAGDRLRIETPGGGGWG
jgi:N-methylhydantoinase B